MPTFHNNLSLSFQAQFHLRWNHLNDPLVRDLAWLLDSPDLLDPQAPQWHGKIATLTGSVDQPLKNWLSVLDRNSGPLHEYLGAQPHTRLGRYAEKLMAYYFQQHGMLVGHGVQVRAEKNDTVGEFDFLLRIGETLHHWEFATKFYLLESSGAGHETDYFVGPNLADTLGAKMRKILDRQLLLAQHPAAQSHLPQPVASAQALIKGWLFYHEQGPHPASSLGLSEGHCRGFWRTQDDLDDLQATYYATLPRLRWLAPAKLGVEQAINKSSLQHVLAEHFAHDTMPVLVALLEQHGDDMIEMDRGFIVPNDWQRRAGLRANR